MHDAGALLVTMNHQRPCATQGAIETGMSRRRLLLIEPDSLTRWSVQRYLEPWFDVVNATDAAEGDRMIDEDRFDAVVISDTVPLSLVERVEQHVRELNPHVKVVRTVADDTDAGERTLLEKPFELSQLARLLGVEP